MNNLTPEQLHALAIVGKEASKVRGKLSVDAHELDFSVNICGTLHVSGDQTATVTSKPTAVDIAALLLGTYGPIKRKTIVADIIAGNKADGINDNLRELANELLNGLASSKTQQRRGAVTGKITASVE